MSLVTKCDVCGAIVDYDPKTVESRFTFFTNKHSYNPDTDGSFDLCPDCTKKMLEFIDVLKSGYDYVIQMEEE